MQIVRMNIRIQPFQTTVLTFKGDAGWASSRLPVFDLKPDGLTQFVVQRVHLAKDRLTRGDGSGASVFVDCDIGEFCLCYLHDFLGEFTDHSAFRKNFHIDRK